jgi:hypothetical protein
MSQLAVARSPDGMSSWIVDPVPLLSPSAGYPQEDWGVEDPRINRVDELDCWMIAYTAFGPQGPAVALATTRDFISVQRLRGADSVAPCRRQSGPDSQDHQARDARSRGWPVSAQTSTCVTGLIRPVEERRFEQAHRPRHAT